MTPASPTLSLAQARLFLLHSHLHSGQGLNQNFDTIINPNKSTSAMIHINLAFLSFWTLRIQMSHCQDSHLVSCCFSFWNSRIMSDDTQWNASWSVRLGVKTESSWHLSCNGKVWMQSPIPGASSALTYNRNEAQSADAQSTRNGVN